MLVVFTDLDGTLLDHDTYSYGESLPGIALLREHGAPLVLVSSKTFDEIALLHRELGLAWPFVFENGGGLAFPTGDDNYDIVLNVPGSEALMEHMPEVARIMARPVYALVKMSVDEIVRATGLPADRAALAQKRRATVPFLAGQGPAVTRHDLDRFNSALEERSIALTRGGLFFHLVSREFDKGAALNRVIEALNTGEHSITTAAVGDSENDIPMLQAVDLPFLVRKKDGSAIDSDVSGITVTRGVGPAGFTEAVRQMLKRS